MVSLVLKVRLILFRMTLSVLLFLLAKIVKVDDKLIIFSSFNGEAYSDNPRYLFEYLIEDEAFADFQFIWAFKSKQKIEGVRVVKFNSFAYYYYLSKAKYWVFNSKMAPYYYKRREQIYLQTWHGTPLKRLGHDLFDNGKTYYRSHLSHQQMLKSYDDDSRHWDYLISPSEFSSHAFASAFKIKQEQILEMNYPRVDYLINFNPEEILKLKKAYRLPLDKKIILHAPTWRDNSFDVKGYKFELIVDFHKWKKILGQNTIILFKPHYLISNVYQVPNDLTDFVYLMEANSDINDAYLMSDSLITDYSSVFFDYANLNRPIYFYMYDFEYYEQKLRGFYLNIPNDLPNDVITKEDDLLVKINNEDFDYERLRKFNQKFNLWNDGKACSKVVRRIFNEN
ncbi:CDP-glycerol glycerophosphotransferase family protein [Lactococcus lactis]|uniref:CDP-glycerol glycerophosphotransferase family protein n=1 Tax=Lactococcus lactis TaxID=1358 RepID=UPI00223BC598|nr:CDP-glycerol glycerophosphotransferase family protein [Lactococcus lactis]MCT1226142.1 CDP-glycerol glycerophosphotransferase family protein [Lactococcus lactis]